MSSVTLFSCLVEVCEMTLIKFCSLLSCHKVAKNFLKAHDMLEMMLIHLTAFLQLNTRHTADQIYCTENCVCPIYMKQHAEDVFTRFISITPQPGLAGLGFVALLVF